LKVSFRSKHTDKLFETCIFCEHCDAVPQENSQCAHRALFFLFNKIYFLLRQDFLRLFCFNVIRGFEDMLGFGCEGLWRDEAAFFDFGEEVGDLRRARKCYFEGIIGTFEQI